MSYRIAKCARCGREMGMGGTRFRVRNRHGVLLYLDHLGDQTICCDALAGEGSWTVTMMKPYPARDVDKPWFKMIERWNAEQAALLEGRAA